MNAAEKESLAAWLYAGLVNRMHEITRTVLMLGGRAPDPMAMVARMEDDLAEAIKLYEVRQSVYTRTELNELAVIATRVVADVRLAVQMRA